MISRDDLIVAAMSSAPPGWHDTVALALIETDPWSRWLVLYETDTDWGWHWFDDPQEAMTYALVSLCSVDARWVPIDIWRLLDGAIRTAIEREVPEWDRALP